MNTVYTNLKNLTQTFLIVAYAVKWPPVSLQWFATMISTNLSFGTTIFPVGKWMRAFSDSRYSNLWVHDLNFRKGLGRIVSSPFAKCASINSPLVGKYPWDKNRTIISYCLWVMQPSLPESSIFDDKHRKDLEWKFEHFRARDFCRKKSISELYKFDFFNKYSYIPFSRLSSLCYSLCIQALIKIVAVFRHIQTREGQGLVPLIFSYNILYSYLDSWFKE